MQKLEMKKNSIGGVLLLNEVTSSKCIVPSDRIRNRGYKSKFHGTEEKNKNSKGGKESKDEAERNSKEREFEETIENIKNIFRKRNETGKETKGLNLMQVGRNGKEKPREMKSETEELYGISSIQLNIAALLEGTEVRRKRRDPESNLYESVDGYDDNPVRLVEAFLSTTDYSPEGGITIQKLKDQKDKPRRYFFLQTLNTLLANKCMESIFERFLELTDEDIMLKPGAAKYIKLEEDMKSEKIEDVDSFTVTQDATKFGDSYLLESMFSMIWTFYKLDLITYEEFRLCQMCLYQLRNRRVLMPPVLHKLLNKEGDTLVKKDKTGKSYEVLTGIIPHQLEINKYFKKGTHMFEKAIDNNISLRRTNGFILGAINKTASLMSSLIHQVTIMILKDYGIKDMVFSSTHSDDHITMLNLKNDRFFPKLIRGEINPGLSIKDWIPYKKTNFLTLVKNQESMEIKSLNYGKRLKEEKGLTPEEEGKEELKNEREKTKSKKRRERKRKVEMKKMIKTNGGEEFNVKGDYRLVIRNFDDEIIMSNTVLNSEVLRFVLAILFFSWRSFSQSPSPIKTFISSIGEVLQVVVGQGEVIVPKARYFISIGAELDGMSPGDDIMNAIGRTFDILTNGGTVEETALSVHIVNWIVRRNWGLINYTPNNNTPIEYGGLYWALPHHLVKFGYKSNIIRLLCSKRGKEFLRISTEDSGIWDSKEIVKERRKKVKSNMVKILQRINGAEFNFDINRIMEESIDNKYNELVEEEEKLYADDDLRDDKSEAESSVVPDSSEANDYGSSLMSFKINLGRNEGVSRMLTLAWNEGVEGIEKMIKVNNFDIELSRTDINKSLKNLSAEWIYFQTSRFKSDAIRTVSTIKSIVTGSQSSFVSKLHNAVKMKHKLGYSNRVYENRFKKGLLKEYGFREVKLLTISHIWEVLNSIADDAEQREENETEKLSKIFLFFERFYKSDERDMKTEKLGELKVTPRLLYNKDTRYYHAQRSGVMNRGVTKDTANLILVVALEVRERKLEKVEESMVYKKRKNDRNELFMKDNVPGIIGIYDELKLSNEYIKSNIERLSNILSNPIRGGIYKGLGNDRDDFIKNFSREFVIENESKAFLQRKLNDEYDVRLDERSERRMVIVSNEFREIGLECTIYMQNGRKYEVKEENKYLAKADFESAYGALRHKELYLYDTFGPVIQNFVTEGQEIWLASFENGNITVKLRGKGEQRKFELEFERGSVSTLISNVKFILYFVLNKENKFEEEKIGSLDKSEFQYVNNVIVENKGTVGRNMSIKRLERVSHIIDQEDGLYMWRKLNKYDEMEEFYLNNKEEVGSIRRLCYWNIPYKSTDCTLLLEREEKGIYLEVNDIGSMEAEMNDNETISKIIRIGAIMGNIISKEKDTVMYENINKKMKSSRRKEFVGNYRLIYRSDILNFISFSNLIGLDINTQLSEIISWYDSSEFISVLHRESSKESVINKLYYYVDDLNKNFERRKKERKTVKKEIRDDIKNRDLRTLRFNNAFKNSKSVSFPNWSNIDMMKMIIEYESGIELREYDQDKINYRMSNLHYMSKGFSPKVVIEMMSLATKVRLIKYDDIREPGTLGNSKEIDWNVIMLWDAIAWVDTETEKEILEKFIFKYYEAEKKE